MNIVLGLTVVGVCVALVAIMAGIAALVWREVFR